MKVEIINVTPQLASEWLAFNTCNRPLRRTTIDGLKIAFLRGEYIQTHQGIAFSVNNELLDGQHRLTAIAEMRDGSFPMVVTTGLPDEAFKVMDIGIKRIASDSLRIDDRRVVEAARMIAAILTWNRSSITPTMLIPIINYIEPVHASIISFCPTSARTWSASAVRVAAVMRIMSGESTDYVRSLYRAFVLSDFDSMPPVARALYKSHINGHVRATDTADMIARCLIAFTERKGNSARIQINDTSDALTQVRRQFGHLIPSDNLVGLDKKKAAPKGAAKSVLPTDSKRFVALAGIR